MSLFYIGHPKETDLALFAGGELGPLARWRIEKHLQSCEACQTAVADFFHLQGDLEELSELPSSVDWEGMSLRIREAVADAGEARSESAGGFFQKPLAWQLGLATAAVFCGFIVVQQFPLPVAEEQVMTASNEQDAVMSGTRVLEGRESAAAVGASSAPVKSLSEAAIADQKREGQLALNADTFAPPAVQERAKIVAENNRLERVARTDETLPGDRIPAAAPPPAPEPEAEPARLAADFRANENARVGAERDAAIEMRGRAANPATPPPPPRQIESQLKDDATMTIALADRVTGPAAVREEFGQAVSEKKESSADEMRLAKAGDALAEQSSVLAEGQTAQVGASFAAPPATVGTSITPATNGDVMVDVKTDGGLRFRTVDAVTGRITITDVYAQ